MKKSLILLLLLLIVVILAVPLSELQAADDKQGTAELSVDEQNKKALEAFNEILDLSESGDRQKVLPQLEAAYYQIITSYPKAYLVQEIYWRLVQIYVNEHVPPAFEKAEGLRREFNKKYSGSKIGDLIDRSIADGYYKNSMWDKLLAFFAPSIKQSVETGTFTKVYDLFMFTEAKFNLNDLVEAEKGYKLIINKFPEFRESKIAKKRLEEIAQKRQKQP